MEKPYLELQELAILFNLSVGSINNSISQNRFPVPTFKLGKFRVADKNTVKNYFAEKAEEGLLEFNSR